MDSAGCVAHVDVCGECYVVETVECMPQCMSSAGSVRHVGVCIMLQTFTAAGHGRYGLSCKFCSVRSLQNGTRCRDGVKYCGVIPILYGWFLRVPYTCIYIVHALVFIQKTVLGLFHVFFFFLEMIKKTEERWEGKPRGGCMFRYGMN